MSGLDKKEAVTLEQFLNQEERLPPGLRGHWPCLDTFLVVTTGGRGGYCI